jgi:hypothetical protein
VPVVCISGGDWALQRSAALFFEGTANSTLEGCELVRLDGNAVMLSGFNQHANLTGNTFLSTGASAIALWGFSNGSHALQPEHTGPDGTDGNFPRWTTVRRCNAAAAAAAAAAATAAATPHD